MLVVLHGFKFWLDRCQNAGSTGDCEISFTCFGANETSAMERQKQDTTIVAVTANNCTLLFFSNRFIVSIFVISLCPCHHRFHEALPAARSGYPSSPAPQG